MKQVLSGLLGLVLVVAMVGLAYVVTRGFVGWFTELDKDRALAVVALVGLVLTPLILLKTFRKDLGHRSWLLNKGDVLSVFVTDIDSG